MENKLKQHFDTFYNRLKFLDLHLGEDEKTFTNTIYYDYSEDSSGKLVKSLVFEENLKDEQIYIRHKGLVLTLVYGGHYNKKYKYLDVYISRDPYYNGNEEASIDELLSLLDEYLINHYKEVYEKINKVIYGEDEIKNHSIKYRPTNILSKDNLKNLSINDAVVKNKDIEHLKRYPNIRQLKINNSTIVANNIGTIPLSMLIIMNSEIESVFCLDHVVTDHLSIFKNKFKSNVPRAITIDTKSFRLDDIEGINLADFFLCTNFRNLEKAYFNNMELNPLEVSLLPVLYNVIELEAYGKATSYKFLDELPELVYFKGIITLVDDTNLKRISNKYKDVLSKHNITEKDKISNYIFYQLCDYLFKHKKFWDSIRLSKLALVKFKSIFENSNEEYIKEILSTPLEMRQHLGEERDITFIKPINLDPFKLIPDLRFEKRYLSKIVGRDGKRLMKPLRIGYTDHYYILDANGKVIEEIKKPRNEMLQYQSITKK